MDHPVESEAGVVDDVVDLAECGDGRLDDGLGPGLVGDVAGEGDGLAAESLDFLGNLVRTLAVNVGNDDRGAFAGCGSRKRGLWVKSVAFT